MILIAIVFSLFGLSFFSSLDPDFGWHYFVGQEMSQSNTISKNLAGYNVFEKLSLPDHEWLSNFILFWLQKHAGYFSLILISVVLLGLTLYFVYRQTILKTRHLLSAIFSTTILLFGLSSFSGVRIQIIIFVAAALLPIIKSTVPVFPKRLLLYFLIFLIGINLHGGFLVLGIIPLFLEFNSISKKGIGKVLLVACVVLLPTILTPYGLNYWKLIIDYSTDNYYKSHINEWLPIYSLPIILEVLIHLSIVIFLFTIDNFWKKIPKNELLMLFIFIIAGIKFRRFYPVFAILVSPYLAFALLDLLQKFRPRNVTASTKKIILILLILLTISFLHHIDFANLRLNPQKNNTYPFLASQFLEINQPKSGNIFNFYSWGGYLLWQHPSMKVFIDGRAPQLKINNHTTILEEYSQFFSKYPSTIAKKLDQYDISSVIMTNQKTVALSSFDQFLLRIDQRLNKKDEISDVAPESRLVDYLASSPNWQKVYEDNIAVVFFRK